MEVFERIRYLRKQKLHLTQEKFGNRLGVSRDVIGNIEYNRLANPEQKEPLIKLICKEFNVNEDWLRTGAGGDENIFIPEDARKYAKPGKAPITPNEFKDFLAFLVRSLPDDYLCKAFLEFEKEREKGE